MRRSGTFVAAAVCAAAMASWASAQASTDHSLADALLELRRQGLKPRIARHIAAMEGDTLTIILGGTDDASTDVDVPPSIAREIYERCARIEPRLPSEYEVDVGFRPLRDRVRLEHEPGTCIIHNYGHGGAGFTVSWGCAREVLRLASTSRTL